MYGKTSYINYPNTTSSKTNIADLIKDNSDAISRNKDDIDDLKKRISTNETNTTQNTEAINKINTTIENFEGLTEGRLNEILNEWKYGSNTRPIILASGKISRSPSTTSTAWEWNGISVESFQINTLEHLGGLMTISFSDKEVYQGKNTHNMIYSVHATQMRSGDTTDTVNNPSIEGRSDGAHWFETRYDNTLKKIYIREFHEGNNDNDTWFTNDWSGNGGGIKEVALTIIGYAYFTD